MTLQNNQGLDKSYQPKPRRWLLALCGLASVKKQNNVDPGLQVPLASADNSYLDLDHSGYHKNLIQ